MRLKWKTIAIRQDKLEEIRKNKSKYEAKTGKTFSSIGDFVLEMSRLLA